MGGDILLKGLIGLPILWVVGAAAARHFLKIGVASDARLHDRNVQSSKMVHAALLLLMLEAVHGPRFTIHKGSIAG